MNGRVEDQLTSTEDFVAIRQWQRGQAQASLRSTGLRVLRQVPFFSSMWRCLCVSVRYNVRTRSTYLQTPLGQVGLLAMWTFERIVRHLAQ
jgi:hypothetical protein